jgi:hypothetical protein
MPRRPKTLTTLHAQEASNLSPREQIAMLAHSLWRERGCPEGSPEVDWFAAEQQLQQRRKAEIVSILQGVRRTGIPA